MGGTRFIFKLSLPILVAIVAAIFILRSRQVTGVAPDEESRAINAAYGAEDGAFTSHVVLPSTRPTTQP
jgi:hypothetical protein